MIQVQLNLPELDNQGKSNRRYLNQLEVEASKKFGGLTSFKGQGKWLNANKLYDEQINIYQFAINKLQKKIFLTLAKKYGVLTGQLAIYVIIDNKVKIINL
tara:strand:- start:1678 stop:1980 length:303 start_codon:yes stop_codon:yes gene_type:complete